MKRFVSFIVTLLLSLAAYSQTGTWSGKVDVQGTSLSVVFHIDESGCTFDSPDQGARGIPAEASLSDLGKVVIKVPSIGATYEGLWLGGRIVGSLSQSGSSFPLTLVPGEPELKRPQTPVGPFPYSCEEVSFSNGDAVLKGTLVLPEGYTRDTPAVIMVTGSGQQNRDEEILGHKPFAVIADALARNGIASLRYDDRGFGESTGDAVFCTAADLKDGALAVSDEAKAQLPEVFEAAERDRIIANSILYEELTLRDPVEKLTGGIMHFPSGYKLRKVTDDFVWIADDKQYTNQIVLVYRYPVPENDPFDKENMIAKRNEVMKANVPGMFDGSYMTTSTGFPVETRSLKYHGIDFVETRGYWEVEGDFMGGPFVSHTFYSQDGKDLIVLEAFVYAARYDKRSYLRQVESILYSFEWKNIEK